MNIVTAYGMIYDKDEKSSFLFLIEIARITGKTLNWLLNKDKASHD